MPSPTKLRMSDEEWLVAKEVCTPRQLAAMHHRRQGMSWRRIGRVMGLDPKTVRDHVEAGSKRLEAELEERAA